MTLSPEQQFQLIELVRGTAAAEIRPRFRRLDRSGFGVKSRFDDLVTEADVAAETALTKGIRDILPHARILGEEAASANPRLLDDLELPGTTVVIDPIDGTWNYAHGVATYGVLLSVIVDGVTTFGLLYDPVIDDWVASGSGEGTWYEQADRKRARTRLSQPGPVSELVGMMMLTLFPDPYRDAFMRAATGFGRVHSLRCACHEYRLLVQGSIDFTVHARLTPWDFSAGVLAVQEAGGAAGFLDGRDYSPLVRDGVLVAANSVTTLETVRKHLNDSIAG
jgi:fructose-1,6-bisphosphatase/inositol monophosphatase family enzyme